VATKTKSVKQPKAASPFKNLTLRVPCKHGGYGWVRDFPDARDLTYSAALPTLTSLPSKVDLRPKCPPVYDQGQLGSCTANGIGGAVQFAQMKLGKAAFTPSRLFIYYSERAIEGTVSSDSGAQVRDGIKSVATIGAPPETDWPYDITQFAVQPPPQAYADAKLDLVSTYAKVPQSLAQMQGCLAEGFPIVFGFTVYSSFESAAVASTGIVPMPNTTKETVLGGHCMLIVGYDDSKRVFIVRNSWNTTWGMKGYCTMPYEYLTNAHLSSDFWTIRAVTN
jgi:C1A family cysteine protease